MLEQLASDIFDKSPRPRLPAVTVGLREVRADRYNKSDALDLRLPIGRRA
jgi:hypothetical protein